MKRMITTSTRGNSFPKDPNKQRLRFIVNDIYDAVEGTNIVDYFADIKSAGAGYIIDYFRLEDGWMDLETAQSIANKIQQVIDDFRYQSCASIEIVEEDSKYITKTYGHPCYHVKVRVK